MEWAQALEILSGFGQGHVVAHDVDNIDPLLDPADNVVGNQTVAHESRDSYFLAWHDRTSRF